LFKEQSRFLKLLSSLKSVAYKPFASCLLPVSATC